ALLHVGRILPGGRARGLEAAALVDGDVHQHAAGLHALEHLAGQHLGRLGAGDQHRAHHQVASKVAAADLVVGAATLLATTSWYGYSAVTFGPSRIISSMRSVRISNTVTL